MLTYTGYSPTSALRSGIVRRTQERLEFDLEDVQYTAPWTPIDRFSVLDPVADGSRARNLRTPRDALVREFVGDDAVEAALERGVRVGRLRRVFQVNSWTLHEAYQHAMHTYMAGVVHGCVRGWHFGAGTKM